MPGWTWTYEGYDPGQERLREALCTLGNGYFATRGAAPESAAGPAHYPGTYAAGCYNRLVSTAAGRRVENEDLVNLPNWLPLRFRVWPHDAIGTNGMNRTEPGWLTCDANELQAYRQILDLHRGVLTRQLRFAVGPGGHLDVEQTRLVHMADAHLAGLCTYFTARNWTGRLEVESAIDGEVTNAGVDRYRQLNGRHLTGWRTGVADADTMWMHCRTTASDISIAFAMRTHARATADNSRTDLTPTRAARLLNVHLASGAVACVEKTVALHTSRDAAISDPLNAAIDRIVDAPGFEQLLASHTSAWQHLWKRAELKVPGEAGRILRLHLFHVLQTLSPHTAELDVGVPARGLHGEAYRGHVFWDELFVLPYLNLHLPEVSRALLTYRHRRLPQAIRAAHAHGRNGAMYPWQSGSDGREESQTLHLNPRSGRWLPDNTHLQHHVGSAIAYNVWQYGQASDDSEFMHTKGAETLFQIARFWASTATWDASTGRYHIRRVVGPDEYHDAYPDATEPGIDDNAYTNVTAAWVMRRALDLARALPVPRRRELFERIALSGEELDGWDEISGRLYVPFHQGVISQFEGYADLAELDWAAYRDRYGSIQRLDRILESEGDTPNRYKASKQADVLMLGYLFSPSELCGLFRMLGYELDDEMWRRTVAYYLCRTCHGSTLSQLVHSWVLARARPTEAWQCWQDVLTGDVADLQGGTTTEGIHLGAMAGTLDLVQRGVTGLETREGALWLDPAPLPELSEFGFSIRFRGHWGVALRMRHGRLYISVPTSDATPIHVILPDRAITVVPGDTEGLDLSASS
ncbi:glycoside hydrolase family 65 protein [Streptomyces sp. RB6PN25]|uniref:Glycoside hydrolase family 65 protein n=1 Tax=Streptomyces humicola TaxID=2953240 RepID=A0ABT1Q625_9ACTN|nr:glycosyl hydrolase family 65 protein [Streptomyces humicola]MCQ4084820.1 glycoside hydrolase family 65 protein [Streptomyces humicola]